MYVHVKLTWLTSSQSDCPKLVNWPNIKSPHKTLHLFDHFTINTKYTLTEPLFTTALPRKANSHSRLWVLTESLSRQGGGKKHTVKEIYHKGIHTRVCGMQWNVRWASDNYEVMNRVKLWSRYSSDETNIYAMGKRGIIHHFNKFWWEQYLGINNILAQSQTSCNKVHKHAFHLCISPFEASSIISTRSAVLATAITCRPLPLPWLAPSIIPGRSSSWILASLYCGYKRKK